MCIRDRSISVYVLYTLTELFIDFVNFLQSMGLTETEEYVVIGVKDDEAYDYSKAVDYMFHGKISSSLQFNSKEYLQARENLYALYPFYQKFCQCGL